MASSWRRFFLAPRLHVFLLRDSRFLEELEGGKIGVLASKQDLGVEMNCTRGKGEKEEAGEDEQEVGRKMRSKGRRRKRRREWR